MQKYCYLISSLLVFCLVGSLSARDVPVDITTGAPSINIPFYNAVNGDLSTPIGISYSANGIKVSKI